MTPNMPPSLSNASPMRVFLTGASGTIGRSTLQALLQQGHEVVSYQRSPKPPTPAAQGPGRLIVRHGPMDSADRISACGMRAERFDAVISCMASRTGQPQDAWAVDHLAHLHLLQAAQSHHIDTFVLLSAICVQRPQLAFQHAKLAFESALMSSGMTYAIVRPTAYFKSLSGQIERLKRGLPFLMFGDGSLTSCKPISDADLADYLVGCLQDTSRHNRILPIGGPGPAITPKQQAQHLFELLGLPPRYKSVPPWFMDALVWGLSTLSPVSNTLRQKAELARIGRYYATESMLVYDPVRGRYDAAATPEHGQDTLLEHYRRIISGEIDNRLGAHQVWT